jgi:hypothetical protein
MSRNYNQLQQLTINLLLRTRSIVVLLSHFSYNFWTQLLNWTELTARSHVSSLYNFGKKEIDTTASNSSSIIVCLLVATDKCLLSRCLAMDVSAVLLWLHISGVQEPCHAILWSCEEHIQCYASDVFAKRLPVDYQSWMLTADALLQTATTHNVKSLCW